MELTPAHEERERQRLREPRGLLALWFAVLAGPLAWMLGLNAQYGLVRVACAKGSMFSLHAVTVLTLALALAGVFVARREWHRAGRAWPDEHAGTLSRSRFMAVLGLLAGALFSLAIVSQWLANVFLNPCMGI
jgi:hypothetical protein